jgi:acyl carrier protein
MTTTHEAKVRMDVLSILGNILMVDEVDPRGNFFADGGGSVAALQALYQVEQRLQVELSFSEFLECEDMGSFADLVASRVTR